MMLKSFFAIKKVLIPTVVVFIIILFFSVSAESRYKVKRLMKTITLFKDAEIVENFRNMSSFINYREIHKGADTFEFTTALQALPETFVYKGQMLNVQELLARTETTGFIVIKNDAIVFEKYYQGNTPEALNISWSVGKSFVSALIGIAIEDGFINSIDESVSDYVPELKASGYNGVSIKNVLQMSSGVRFDEDYGSFNSDINRMGRTIALGASINEFAASLKSERNQGEYNHYVSMDTQVLGMVLTNATGKSLSNSLEEKIWKQIGMESNARWLIDDTGMELAFGTLNVTLRDYARFGRLYLNQGNWNGRQIVPAKWVKDSITPDAPHLIPGENPLSKERFGYGYQWWIPEDPKGDFMALGVYGQCIYINPLKGVIIVKNAAYPNWTEDMESDYALIAMFQQISDQL